MTPWFAPRTHGNPWPNKEIARTARNLRRCIRKSEKRGGLQSLFWHYWLGKPDWSMSANMLIAKLIVEACNNSAVKP